MSYALKYKDPLIIIALGMFFFLPFIGSVHLFDWDEINFAESAREMIVSGNYGRVTINFEPFWEKPPLFFWFQALSMKIFGINEFAARLPNAIIGMITLISIFCIGKKHYNRVLGYMWSLLYMGSFLPHLYFKSGIIDPVFNYFIFIAIYFLIRNIDTNFTKYALLAGLFIGLAVLTKGPVGLLLLLLTFLVYWACKKFKKTGSIKNILLFALVASSVTCFWFGFEIAKNGSWFLVEFVQYQIALFSEPVAGHGQPFYYHFVVVLIGCFPISILALPVLIGKCNIPENLALTQWMKYLFWVVIILFSTVTTKIVHYSSMTYIPLAFLAAVYVQYLINTDSKPLKWVKILLFTLGGFWAFLLTFLPAIPHIKAYIIGYIKDPFAVANLNARVNWNGFEWLIGLVYGSVLMWQITQFSRGNIKINIIRITLSTATCILIFMAMVVPKIEAHSQRSAITFFESVRGKDVYVNTYGYKSYAHYFYFRTPPNQQPESKNENWLMNGAINKPVYFIAKITNREKLLANKSLKEVYNRGGFVVFRREVPDLQKK